MSYRRESFAPGEWYHCYTRGIDKRPTFECPQDYRRFIEALYLSNSIEMTVRGHFQHKSHDEILSLERGSPLVAIGAYALMPNHYHICLKELEEGGISKFMQRVGTSYGMYFNIKNQRVGNLFVKPFRSKHISSDEYLKKIIGYIHLNPVEIYEPQWKKGIVMKMALLKKRIETYTYSSLPDYIGENRLQKNILAWNEITDFLLQKMPSLEKILHETREYYEEISL